jgi:hypothetical protein
MPHPLKARINKNLIYNNSKMKYLQNEVHVNYLGEQPAPNKPDLNIPIKPDKNPDLTSPF